MSNKKNHKVAIAMGSQSDYSTMKYCAKVLKILKIKHETKIVSAHRTPDRMYKFSLLTGPPLNTSKSFPKPLNRSSKLNSRGLFIINPTISS